MKSGLGSMKNVANDQPGRSPAHSRGVWEDLDLGAFSKGKRIFDVDAQISDCAFDFGVTKQDLHPAQITCLLVNDRSLCPPQGLRSIVLCSKANRND